MIWIGVLGVGAAILAVIARGIVPLALRLVAAGHVPGAGGGILGIALSFALVTGVLFVANPDHLAALQPRAVEAASLAALAGVLWLPWFLVLYAGRLKEMRGE
ncbi:MAG TPA: hypothetical protein VLA78_09570 [Paracoccaceae bacterium]|nr:hypothetical protein [Paracoccaceae bacterium]